MSIVLLNTHYPEFLGSPGLQHPHLKKQSDVEEMRMQAESRFGLVGFPLCYRCNVGHEGRSMPSHGAPLLKVLVQKNSLGE